MPSTNELAKLYAIKPATAAKGVNILVDEGVLSVSYTHLDVYKRQSKGQLYKETYQYPSRKAMKKMKAEIKKNVNGRSLLVAKEIGRAHV